MDLTLSILRLNEQELVDEIGDKLDWDGVNSITAIQSQALADVRQAISSNQVEGYLTNLKSALLFDKQKALDTARELMQSDGEEAREERRLYDQLLHTLMTE